jgi:hypothetical protein
MAYEQKDLRGAIFVNSRKEKSTSPDYKGTCKIDDVEYWISGWSEQPRGGGEDYISLAFSKKKAKDDDDIPF